MLFLDVNIPVYAHRGELSESAAAVGDWLDQRLVGTETVGIAELVLSAAVRIVTNSRTWERPSSPEQALEFCSALLRAPAAMIVRPGARHWSIFTTLVSDHRLRGNDVADVYLASLALEHGATMVTRDRGFRRFDGLRVLDPLAP